MEPVGHQKKALEVEVVLAVLLKQEAGAVEAVEGQTKKEAEVGVGEGAVLMKLEHLELVEVPLAMVVQVVRWMLFGVLVVAAVGQMKVRTLVALEEEEAGLLCLGVPHAHDLYLVLR